MPAAVFRAYAECAFKCRWKWSGCSSCSFVMPNNRPQFLIQRISVCYTFRVIKRSQIMTRIEIPIRLRFLRVPTQWAMRMVLPEEPDREAHLFAFPTVITDRSLDAFQLTQQDAWACREEFLSLRVGDTDGLRNFLESVGLWFSSEHDPISHRSREITEHLKKGNPTPITVAGLWRFQRSLRDSLLKKKAFKETYAPEVGRPLTGLQLLNESREGIEFPLRVELTNVVAGVVTLTDAYRVLLATVFFDVARGIRFKTCQRPDCRRPFPLESKHERKFCRPYCAHITAVRRDRGKKKRQTA